MWADLLTPTVAVEGVTVLRTIGGVQLVAETDGTVTRPTLLRAGVLVGPEPNGTELDGPNANLHDWLWIGSEQTVPATVDGTSLLLTAGAGQLGHIESKGARRLGAGESVWFTMDASLTTGVDFNGVQLIMRVLYLPPA